MAPSTKVRVLHRATDEHACDRDAAGSTSSIDEDLERHLKKLKAEVESLKQRLDQVNPHWPMNFTTGGLGSCGLCVYLFKGIGCSRAGLPATNAGGKSLPRGYF